MEELPPEEGLDGVDGLEVLPPLLVPPPLEEPPLFPPPLLEVPPVPPPSLPAALFRALLTVVATSAWPALAAWDCSAARARSSSAS